MKRSANLEKLKKIIKERSFVRSEEADIFGKNGMKKPWIFNVKKVILDPLVLRTVADIFWEKFRGDYPFQVGGQETTAIPLISAIVCKSLEEGKPVSGFYIRKSRKKDGLQKIIEGELSSERVILIDDLINSGKSIDRQIMILGKENRTVNAVFTLINFRKLEKYDFLKKLNIRIVSLFPITEFGIDYIADETLVSCNYYNILWSYGGLNPEYFHVVPKSTPVLDENNVYFGSDDGYFRALSQEDGALLWSYRINWFSGKGIFSSPALHERNIYFGAYDGNVYCLDAKTGKRKWTFFEADWVGSSPVVAEDLGLLFVGLEFGLLRKRGGLIALDLKTGKKVWEHKMSEFVHCSPSYCREKGKVAIGGNDGLFYMFNAKNGKLLWKLQTGGEIKYGSVFSPEKKLISFGSMDSNFYTCDIDSGKVMFKYSAGAGIYADPLLYGNKMIFASLDKNVYCLDLDKKEEVWRYQTDGRVFSSPALIEDSIFFGSNDGRMYEINPETGELRSFFQFTERITNKIAYNEKTGRFFVLTQANDLYCLSRRFSSKK